VRFVKSRAFPGCQLHHADFATRDGKPRHLLARTWQQPDGSWAAVPIGSGGGRDTDRSRPWVNFAAAWNAQQFAAGGHVTGQGAETARLVRLTFADGTTIEDTVDNGVVPFFTSPGVTFQPKSRSSAPRGNTLAAYDEFSDLE
jgi:hypothetical protein